MNQQKQKNNSNRGEVKSSPFDLKPIQRKCAACGGVFGRENLIRIMSENKTGEIIINPDNKTFGRSAYLCQNENCIKNAIKKNRLERVLRAKISENVLEKLKLMLN